MSGYVQEKLSDLNIKFKSLADKYRDIEYQLASEYQLYSLSLGADEREEIDIKMSILDGESLFILDEIEQIQKEQKNILKDVSIFEQLTSEQIIKTTSDSDTVGGYKVGRTFIMLEELLNNEEVKSNSDFSSKLEELMNEKDDLDINKVSIKGHFQDDQFICTKIKCFNDNNDFVSINFKNGRVKSHINGTVKKNDSYINLDYSIEDDTR